MPHSPCPRWEMVSWSMRLLAAHPLAGDCLMHLSERRVQGKRCAGHHAWSRSRPTIACRLALSGGAVTSTMTGGTHGRAEVPRLQKTAGVAHEAEQQLATFMQALLS